MPHGRATVASVRIVVAAGIEQADDAGDDQHDHGEQQVDDLAVGVELAVFQRLVDVVAGGVEIAVEHGVHLVQAHRAEVELHEDDRDDEHDGQQRIEVIGDRLHEQDEALAVLGVARNGGGPGADRGDHADRGGGRVDEVGELCAADLVAVGDREHDGADGQAVEIVVHEDEHAQNERGDHGADAALDVLLGPASEGRAAAGAVDEHDEDAEDDEEHEVAREIRDGGDDRLAQHRVERADGGEVVGKERAQQHADEQGGEDLLRDQREDDRDDGRHERPERIGHGAARGDAVVVHVHGEAGDGQKRHGEDDQQHDGKELAAVSHDGCLQIKIVS